MYILWTPKTLKKNRYFYFIVVSLAFFSWYPKICPFSSFFYSMDFYVIFVCRNGYKTRPNLKNFPKFYLHTLKFLLLQYSVKSINFFITLRVYQLYGSTWLNFFSRALAGEIKQRFFGAHLYTERKYKFTTDAINSRTTFPWWA